MKTDEPRDFMKMLDKLKHRLYGDLSFSAICPICGEPVDTDDGIDVYKETGVYVKQPNATCAVHGRIEMPYDGKIVKHFGEEQDE